MIMANVNVRIDPKIKKEAEDILYSLGITPSSAINMFYHQVIINNGIPFELKGDVPNKKTRKAIKEVGKIEKHPHKNKTYKDVSSLMDDLNK